VTTRLCLLTLFVAAIISLTLHASSVIYSDGALPVPADELLRLNPN
jgi:hypothetical protein